MNVGYLVCLQTNTGIFICSLKHIVRSFVLILYTYSVIVNIKHFSLRPLCNVTSVVTNLLEDRMDLMGRRTSRCAWIQDGGLHEQEHETTSQFHSKEHF